MSNENVSDFRALMTESFRGEGFSPFGSAQATDIHRIRMFEHLVAPSGTHVSVQASFNHYCFPRETANLYDYDSFEVAIFTSDDEMCRVSDILGINSSVSQSFEEYYADPVYGNVPVAKLQRLCESLGIIG